MKWDDLFETMIREIASDLSLEITKPREGYMLSGEGISVGFMYFVDRDGKLKITMSSREKRGRPEDLGNYTMEELQGNDSKAKRAITTKLIETGVLGSRRTKPHDKPN